MKYCLYCGKALSDDYVFCNYCGAKQSSTHRSNTQMSSPVRNSPISSPEIKPQKTSSKWLIIIVILIIIGGVILVPIIAPDLAKEKPGDLLLYGGSFFIIGVIAWLLEWSGKVRLIGRASCCMFFPLIGLFVFLYGLFSFFTH